ncbi:MAG: T9SS type A sorting domain-containing protein [Prevotellaceae bacterium]|jgi:hypothetical protein|nr:T9SS type A sorting domain-containing protein [Prevotellaceae bacterium]
MKKIAQMGWLLILSLTLTNAAFAVDSEYCRTTILPGDAEGRACVISWNTEANGNITIAIAGVPGDNVTKFRAFGWCDDCVKRLTVNGTPNTDFQYFTRTINDEKTVITLTPAQSIPDGATIVINEILEYATALNGNAWPTVAFTYTYGSLCIGESEYCRTTILPGDNRACVITWNTETNGNITVAITGIPGDNVTKFRGDGWSNDRFANLTVNGDPNTANKYFVRTINAEKTLITLTPQQAIPRGATIYINQILEYATALDGNAWPTVAFTYTYGSTCSAVTQTQLAQPVITAIAATGEIAFTSDPNAGNNVVTVYMGTTTFAAYSQSYVTSGDAINFTAPGTYTVRVLSKSLQFEYTDSEPSAPFNWTIPGTPSLPPSEYCRATVQAGTTEECIITWNTEDNGNITVSITGIPGDNAAFFRNNGWSDERIAAMTIGGNPNTGQSILRRTINADKSVMTLTPAAGVTIPPGTPIYINQILEYRTTANTNAYPTLAFTYTYGSKCAPIPRVPLSAPVITGVSAARAIAFTSDSHAAHHTATVYRGTSAYVAHTQANIVSGDVIDFTTPGTYTLKVQSHSNVYEYLDSELSAPYTWVIPGTPPTPAVGSSEICRLAVNPSGDGAATGDYQTEDVALFSMETRDDGALIVKIAPVDASSTQTAFRGNGMSPANFTVNGQAGTWFTAAINAEKTEIVFTPLIALLVGDKISYNGMIEYKTSDAAAGGLNNLYPIVNFGQYILYTYGTNCSVAPEVTVQPSTIQFSPAVAVQTFMLSGKHLQGPVDITPSAGLAVQPVSMTPNADGVIYPRPVTVVWTEGASAGGSVKVSGGGLALPKEVLVTSTGFSEYCNKIITNADGSFPANLTIGLSSDKTVLSFTVSPVNGTVATWNNNSITQASVTVNGAAPAGGVTRAAVGDNVLTLTFGTPLATGDVVAFGMPLVWTTYNAAGERNGNCYINPALSYTVGLSCEVTAPAPATPVAVTGVTLIEALATTARATVTATDGTYPVATIRFVEEEGKVAPQLLSKTATNEYELTGLAPITSYSFIVSAIDANGYPSDDYPARLQFTTTKMPQTITFPAIPSLRLEDGSYTLNATVSSDLPIYYEIDNLQIADFYSDGVTVRLKAEGATSITATQPGSTYYAAAEPVTRELVVLSTRVTEFTVVGATFDPEKNYYLMDCGVDQVTITVVTFDPQATVHYNGSEVENTFTIPIAQPGVYWLSYAVGSRDGQFSTDYPLTIARPFNSAQVIEQHWNNTLTVINEPANNGGYHFTAYKWFKNGDHVSNRQWYSAGNKGESLNPADEFYVELSAEEYEGSVRSCRYTPSLSPARMIASAYPNPVDDGKVFVRIDGDQTGLEGAVIMVYSATGVLVKTAAVTGALTEIQLPPATGIYLLQLQNARKQTLQSMKVLLQ